MTCLKSLLSLILLSLFTTRIGFSQLPTHLDGAFVAANFTWDDDDDPGTIDVAFHYNPANAPQGTPSVNAIRSYANSAMSKWNGASSQDRIQLSTASSFQTSDGQVDNTTNVILWGFVDGGDAITHHYPNLLGGAGYGYETEEGADIVMNKNINFLYGASPPRSGSAKDFEETLIHELGHVHGLHHPSSDDHVMHGMYASRDLTIGTLSNGDKAGAYYQHPKAEIQGTLPSYPLALTAREDNIDVTGNLTITNRLDVEDGTFMVPSSSTTITLTGSNADVTMESGSSLTGGKLVIQNGGTLTMEGGLLDDGEITIKDGGTLIVQGGTIQRRDITVENGGTLQTSGNPTFRFSSNQSLWSTVKLEINGGTFEAYSTDWLYISTPAGPMARSSKTPRSTTPPSTPTAPTTSPSRTSP